MPDLPPGLPPDLRLDGPPPRPRGLAGIVRHEQALVSEGLADGCGKTCDDGCHGDLTCVRQAHPHDPAVSDVVPHAGYSPTGELVQWTCLPGDHDGLTAEARQTARTAAATSRTAAATRQLLDSIDLDVFAEALAGPLAAAIARHGQDPR